MAACSAPRPPTIADPRITTASDAYAGCAWAEMQRLQGTMRADPAVQVASIALRLCEAKREQVRAAVLAVNPARPAFADSFTTGLHDQLTANLAARMLQGR